MKIGRDRRLPIDAEMAADFEPPVASLIPEPMTEPPTYPYPTKWAPTPGGPAPERFEGAVKHETGPLHPSAIRAAALAAAVALLPTDDATLETLSYAPGTVIEWAKIFAQYIESGEFSLWPGETGNRPA